MRDDLGRKIEFNQLTDAEPQAIEQKYSDVFARDQ
jgi:hypothetical protein